MDHLMLKENRDKIQRNPNQVARGINDFSKPMMLWASNEVIQSYAEYRQLLFQRTELEASQAGIESLVRFEKMLFLMREDMGHNPGGFRQLDLLAFFVNDIHKYEFVNGTLTKTIP
jgi:hypothetical protein